MLKIGDTAPLKRACVAQQHLRSAGWSQVEYASDQVPLPPVTFWVITTNNIMV